MNCLKKKSGLTIAEIMIAVSIVVVIFGVGLLVMDPIGQFAAARNAQRSLHLQTIATAISGNLGDTRADTFSCSAGPLPTSSKKMASGGASGTYDIAPCLVPVFVQALPFDPTAPGAHFTDVGSYDTGYVLIINGSGTVTLSAPSSELNQVVTYSFSTLKGQ